MINNITSHFTKVLPKQKCYKVKNGDSSEVPLRLGRLDSELYRNKSVINTIYGEQEFIPKIDIFVNTYTDDKSYITINIINDETKVTAKQIIIRSQPNKLTLSTFKNLYDEIILLLDTETDAVIKLIELLRNKNLEIEEYC